MKRRILLNLLLLTGVVGNAGLFAQESCENASASMVVMLNGDHTDGKWYSVNITTPSLFPMSTPAGIEKDAITIYEDCDGTEAVKIESNSYYLEAGQYKVFVKSSLNEGMLMLMGTPVNNAPAGMYCFKPIELTAETWGQFQTPRKNATTWYSIPVAYPAPVVVAAHTQANPFTHNEGIITKVVTKLSDCRGGTNESNELLPNRAYAKGGTNLVAVTIGDADFTNIGFSLDALSATGCNNHVDHAPAISLDVEQSYPNAFYTVDYRFVVPEDGTYTFTNHGAEGTILRIGKFIEKTEGGYGCDFETNPLSATVDENNEAAVAATFKAGDVVIVESDAFGQIGEGLPFLKVTKGGTSGIIRTQSTTREIRISENPNNGNFSVSSFLLKEGADIVVYDMAARKVHSQRVKSAEDEAQVSLNVRPGQYLVVVYGKGRSAATQIIVR